MAKTKRGRVLTGARLQRCLAKAAKRHARRAVARENAARLAEAAAKAAQEVVITLLASVPSASVSQ